MLIFTERGKQQEIQIEFSNCEMEWSILTSSKRRMVESLRNRVNSGKMEAPEIITEARVESPTLRNSFRLCSEKKTSAGRHTSDVSPRNAQQNVSFKLACEDAKLDTCPLFLRCLGTLTNDVDRICTLQSGNPAVNGAAANYGEGISLTRSHYPQSLSPQWRCGSRPSRSVANRRRPQASLAVSFWHVKGIKCVKL